MAEGETQSCLPGFRFNPLDEELINDYLKPFMLRENLPCNIIKRRPVYGPSNPWHVFDPNDNRLWFTSPDIKDTEKYTFAFAKLSKLSKSNTSTLKNTSKKAGCGTWVGMTCRDQITDDEDNVIGEKRYLVFKIKNVDSAAGVGGVDLSKVGCFRMHEYSLSGVNSGLDDSADTTVLCKITHDSSKVCKISKKTGTTSSSKAVKKEENNNNLESDRVKAENLTLIDCGGGGGDNLDESKTFNSQSLVERISDIGDWPAAPQYNSGVQEVDELGGHFCFGGYSFSLDDLGFKDTDWMEYLNFKQEEEPLEDSTNNKPGKRMFELEENLHQAKKMCLE